MMPTPGYWDVVFDREELKYYATDGEIVLPVVGMFDTEEEARAAVRAVDPEAMFL